MALGPVPTVALHDAEGKHDWRNLCSAVKRKFGDRIRSRLPVAMVNEALAKLVCNNLCCVILSPCEIGIEAKFWDNKPPTESAAQPAILSLPRNK